MVSILLTFKTNSNEAKKALKTHLTYKMSIKEVSLPKLNRQV